MMDAKRAREFTRVWIDTWNSHDLDRIMALYADDIELVSPVAALALGDTSGTVSGWKALRAYYKSGLERFPHLNFQLIESMWGLSSIVIYYVNHKGTRTCDYFELNAAGKIARNRVHYSD